MQELPYKFLSIEGNIGSGKTTLARILSADLGAELILEQFSDNPFLSEFYKDRDRYAFPVEVFFLSERHKQMTSKGHQRNLFTEITIADYCFYKTALFASQNLNEREFSVFYKLYQQLSFNLPNPDLLIYLHRPVSELLTNINKRGRPYENLISNEYLSIITKAYNDYFSTVQDFPILWINMENLDFKTDPGLIQLIKNLLNQEYSNGLNQIDLSPDIH